MSGNLIIKPTFDSSITSLANAATIEATINTAIAVLENDVTAEAPVTVSIDFKNITTGLANSSTPQADLNYSKYLADLQANPNKSVNDTTALAAMPAGPNTGINGATQVLLTAADLTALGETSLASGLVSGNGGFDSTLSFNFGIINDSRPAADPAQYDLQATATHEIDEVLGIGGMPRAYTSRERRLQQHSDRCQRAGFLPLQRPRRQELHLRSDPNRPISPSMAA